MKLNHLDLQVADVQQSVHLFETIFGLTCDSNRASPALAFLSDGQGFTLVLQKKKDDAEKYPDGFHLGFLVDTVSDVERVHALATSAGHQVSDVITNGRGTMIYLRSSDGYLVEVSVRKH